MLHKLRVLKALKGNALRQTRILLGLKSRPKAPVLNQPVEKSSNAIRMICQRLVNLWPADFALAGASVCEIGPGIASPPPPFLCQSAGHVDLVELQTPVLNEKQFRILST